MAEGAYIHLEVTEMMTATIACALAHLTLEARYDPTVAEIVMGAAEETSALMDEIQRQMGACDYPGAEDVASWLGSQG